MPFIQEFLLLAVIPLAIGLILLAGHFATLRGLRGGQRVEAFRILADAVMRRR
ncbi:hypothetical protein [Streptomyces sp. SID10815]|uniref:hypothetical protein n=1 Tax=Streptomyces sp. SID10815 TaxID=2706027 RepID=UPI0013C8BAA0|nr:hypothetical protein [Streptomyces sp. SID10815]NEA46323.1 hypothetical protein [Streptomyces sp. SID10815]